MLKPMKNWALITGASAGIGCELSKLFAANGYNVVLVARDRIRLESLAAELRTRYPIHARVLVQDLSQSGAAQKIFDELVDLPVTALVNNAGFGVFGLFSENDLTRQTEMVQVNVTALMQLTHLFLKPMLLRGSGRILNVASTAAFQPGPTVNVYYATKAFVYSFSYALADELDGSGVTVTTLCPGGTRTEFFDRAGHRPLNAAVLMDAALVARIGYRGLMHGQRVVIPGLLNRIMAFISKRLPGWMTSPVVRRIHK